MLSEARETLGGRVIDETALQSLSDWRRVADHRTYMLSQRANVQSYTNSELTVSDILEADAAHIAIATGSHWKIDFTGLQHHQPVSVTDDAVVIGVDEVLRGARPAGKILIYDDDHYYMASVIAEQLASEGSDVTLVTPANDLAGFTHYTLEHEHNQIRLRQLGVEIICNKEVRHVGAGSVTLNCVYVDTTTELAADAVIPVTARRVDDSLYTSLIEQNSTLINHGIKSVKAIGDCYAPATIAIAVYAGHEYARTLDQTPEQASFFKRELGLGGEQNPIP